MNLLDQMKLELILQQNWVYEIERKIQATALTPLGCMNLLTEIKTLEKIQIPVELLRDIIIKY